MDLGGEFLFWPGLVQGGVVWCVCDCAMGIMGDSKEVESLGVGL